LNNRTWPKLLVLILIIAGSTLILYETGLVSFFLSKEKITRFLNSLGPLSFIGFIALQASQVVLSPIPGEITGFIGGFLYGTLLGIVLSTTGLTIGSWAAFSLSRVFGRPFVEKFIKQETLERYDYLLHHKGGFLVFLLFLMPGFPKDYLCYVLGLGHLDTKTFLVISTVGRFTGTVLLTLGGTYIRNAQYYQFSALLGLAIVFLFISLVYRDKLEKLFRKLHTEKTKNKKQ
jgi:uncharacterized membrane protein YdjX (TVP38/TMEM64 family)